MGNFVVLETPIEASNLPGANDEDETSSPNGPSIQGLPAYLAWLKRGHQFAFDSIYQKEDIELVKFDTVDPNAPHLVLDAEDILLSPVDGTKAYWGDSLADSRGKTVSTTLCAGGHARHA